MKRTYTNRFKYFVIVMVVFLMTVTMLPMKTIAMGTSKGSSKGESSSQEKKTIKRKNAIRITELDELDVIEDFAEKIHEYTDTIYIDTETDEDSMVQTLKDLDFEIIKVYDSETIYEKAEELLKTKGNNEDKKADKPEISEMVSEYISNDKNSDGFALKFVEGLDDKAKAKLIEVSKGLKKADKKVMLYSDAYFGADKEVMKGSKARSLTDREKDIISTINEVDPENILITFDAYIERAGNKDDLMYQLEGVKKIISKSEHEFTADLKMTNLLLDEYELSSEIIVAKGNASGVSISALKSANENNELFEYNEEIHKKISNLLYEERREDLSFDNSLRIKRPDKDIKVFYGDTYYVMGVCDPRKELKIEVNNKDETMVKDRGTNGSFGHFITLQEGENEIFISQGGVGETVTIEYIPPDKVPETSKKTKTITGARPSVDQIYKASSVYQAGCTAPAGANVYAKLGEQTISLKQINTNGVEEGTPVIYEGEFYLGSKISSDEVASLGNVSYSMDYDGKGVEVDSSGKIYIYGNNAKIFVKANRSLAEVYDSVKGMSNYDFIAEYPIGTVEEFTGYKEGGLMGLGSGGLARAVPYDIMEGSHGSIKDFIGDLETVSFSTSKTKESIKLGGLSYMPHRIATNEDSVSIKLYYEGNRKTLADLEIVSLTSDLFSKFEMDEQDDYVELNFTLKKGKKLDGCSISYESGGAVIYFKKPVRGAIGKEKNLEGVTILLDAGHGGTDTGAFAPTQEEGPYEADVALATTMKVKDELESKGATVYMLRDANYFVELYDRAGINERIKPDYFLSIHLNSVEPNRDAGEAAGMEIYMHNDEAEHLANMLLENMDKNLNRKNRGIKYGAYVIARPNTEPSLLCEIGFISNPNEYEEMMEEKSMEITANSISDAIISLIYNED